MPVLLQKQDRVGRVKMLLAISRDACKMWDVRRWCFDLLTNGDSYIDDDHSADDVHDDDDDDEDDGDDGDDDKWMLIRMEL